MHCASRIPLTSSEGAESPLTASRKPTQEPIRKRTSLSGSKDDGKSRAKGAEGAQKEAVSTTAIAKPSTKAERRALQVCSVVKVLVVHPILE